MQDQTYVEKLVYFKGGYGDTPVVVIMYEKDLKDAPRGYRIFKLRIPVPPRDQWDYEQPEVESFEALVSEALK